MNFQAENELKTRSRLSLSLPVGRERLDWHVLQTGSSKRALALVSVESLFNAKDRLVAFQSVCIFFTKLELPPFSLDLS